MLLIRLNTCEYLRTKFSNLKNPIAWACESKGIPQRFVMTSSNFDKQTAPRRLTARNRRHRNVGHPARSLDVGASPNRRHQSEAEAGAPGRPLSLM